MRQRIEQTFVPNVFGQAGFTEDMLPLLRKAGETGVLRIVFVSSRLGSLANALDPNAPFYENDFRSYNYSKAALNMPALNYDRMAWVRPRKQYCFNYLGNRNNTHVAYSTEDLNRTFKVILISDILLKPHDNNLIR